MTADPLRPFDQRSAGVATTERVLFGRLVTEDPVSGVVRRIRTAIGLGILTDGQRLPREADLARQLGVTVFSLREALGLLRDEGLIVTRVGKNGGSYVDRPPASESLAADQLVRMTSTDLRDLGDWRTALATYAAWLAARRGSAVSSDRLSGYAQELAEAGTPSSARRALGRFHMELAAAAQSMRLTHAELTIHEEFDWLVQVVLRARNQRVTLARLMQRVCDAIRANDADGAWRAAEQMTAFLVTGLMRGRLQLVAERSGSQRDHGRDLTAELRRCCDHVLTMLEQIAQGMVSDLPDSPTSADLGGALSRAVLPRLQRFEGLVYGTGFMATVGILPDATYWMQWWQRTADGSFDRDYSHQLDPSRDDFYEYGSQEYLTEPRRTGEPNAMGPYIDHGGVDDYLITVSRPVTKGGVFLGVICVDIRVASLEDALSPWLGRANTTCLLLNSESRVLLSNSVRYRVGDLLPGTSSLMRADTGCFGWSIATNRPGD